MKLLLTVSGSWNSVTCTWNKVLYKRGVLKNFSKFSDKHKEQSSGGVLSKDILKIFVKLSEKHLCGSLRFNKVAGWKFYTGRSSHWRFVKQGVLKKFWKFRRKKSVLESIFNKFWRSSYGLQLYSRRLQHRFFPVKFTNFL